MFFWGNFTVFAECIFVNYLHFIYRGPNVIYYVGAGRNDNEHERFPSGSMKFLHGQTRRSKLFYRHNKYDDENLEHDIALMKVCIYITFRDYFYYRWNNLIFVETRFSFVCPLSRGIAISLIMYNLFEFQVQQPFHPSSSLALVKLPSRTETSDLTKLYRTCYIGGWGLTGANFMQIFDHSTNTWKYNQWIMLAKKKLSNLKYHCAF